VGMDELRSMLELGEWCLECEQGGVLTEPVTGQDGSGSGVLGWGSAGSG
jgi:hypothetical protein